MLIFKIVFYFIGSIANDEDFVNENKTDDDYPRIELVEVVSLPEEDESEEIQTAGITLNLTGSKDINTTSPNSAEEADRSASSSSPDMSTEQDIITPSDPKKPVLSLEYTFHTPTARPTRSSERRRSLITNRQSYTRSTQSLIPPIVEQEPTISEEEKDPSSNNISIYSTRPSSSTTPMLSKLSTNRTVISEAPSIILQKSLADSASPSPNPTPIITVRQSERLSSSLSPRRNINPLHSSTPSVRNKSLQMISIGEEEQLTTTVPQQFNIDLTTDMIDNEQQVDIPIQSKYKHFFSFHLSFFFYN